jgi:hypothetical protein
MPKNHQIEPPALTRLQSTVMPGNETNGVYFKCVHATDAHLRLTDDESFYIDDDAGETWICRQVETPDLPIVEADEEDIEDETRARIVFCESIDDLPQKLAHSQQTASEASYICDSCGEEIVVPIDVSEGESQQYVEDCPVCCHPNVIHVDMDEDGTLHVWGEAE